MKKGKKERREGRKETRKKGRAQGVQRSRVSGQWSQWRSQNVIVTWAQQRRMSQEGHPLVSGGLFILETFVIIRTAILLQFLSPC